MRKVKKMTLCEKLRKYGKGITAGVALAALVGCSEEVIITSSPSRKVEANYSVSGVPVSVVKTRKKGGYNCLFTIMRSGKNYGLTRICFKNFSLVGEGNKDMMRLML